MSIPRGSHIFCIYQQSINNYAVAVKKHFRTKCRAILSILCVFNVSTRRANRCWHQSDSHGTTNHVGHVVGGRTVGTPSLRRPHEMHRMEQ